MSKNSDEIFTIQYEIDPLDVEYFRFIELVPPDTEKGKKALADLDKLIELNQNFFQECVDESEKHRRKLFMFNPASLSGLRPQVRYVTRKLEKMQQKLVEFSENFFITAASKISRIAHFLSEAKKSNCPVIIYYHELRKFIQKQHDFDPLNVKLRKRIAILDFYANKMTKMPILPIIPDQQIIAVAREVSNTVDPVTLHSVPSVLDDFIYYYVMANDCLSYFDQLVDRIKVKSKLINMKPLTPFVVKFAQRFGEIEKNEIQVIRVTLLRFFFDRFYIKYPQLFIEQSELEKFIKNCSKMSSMSTKELRIPKKFVRDGEDEVPLKDLVSRNGILQEALENLLKASFYAYPTDILQCIYGSMKCVEKYTKTAELERKYGSNIEWDSREAAVAASDMAFDDFFPLFTGVFSIAPPSNAVAIYHFFEMVEKLSIPTTFDFAKVIFMTGVSHILDFDTQQQPSESQ